jgi:hypothetical protein
MKKKFKKKNVLMRSGMKDKGENVSIHRKRHREFRKRLLARLKKLAQSTIS